MIELLLAHAIGAALAPAIMRKWKEKGFLILALFPASVFIWALTQARAVFHAPTALATAGAASEASAGLGSGAVGLISAPYPSQAFAWAPVIGLNLDFRLDMLSWVMTLLVGGIGALVLVYSAAYFSSEASYLGRFGAVFVAFAGAMFGLVTADNTLLLYTFWELTTVFSFLLIGHHHERQPSRRAAMQAIIVTTFGGLAMLAGIIMIAEMPGGSYSLSRIVAAAQAGELGVVPPDADGAANAAASVATGAADAASATGHYSAVLTVAVILILLGAVGKSALVPFHFWLPAAMAAPTPVSAYLHAAAMVKAGVFLVARLAPAFGGMLAWQIIVLGLGLTTMILGGYRSLREYDLKLVLAYGTVSQLGFIIALVGYGQQSVALAGVMLIIAHATFKACLFLSVGIVDWSTGTRDLRELSGLGRQMPLLATVAAIAAASMAGIPLTAGFLGKEGALAALDHLWHSAHDGAGAAGAGAAGHAAAATANPTVAAIVFAVIVAGSILTFAYGMRFWWGAFASKPGVDPVSNLKRSRLIMISPVVLAIACLGLGLIPAQLQSALEKHAAINPGAPGHLAIWAGFGLPLLATIGIIAVGLVMFRARMPIERFQARISKAPDAAEVYRKILRGLDLLSADVTAGTQRGSLPAYLMIVMTVMITAGLGTLVMGTPHWPDAINLYDSRWQIPVAVVAIAAALITTRAKRRVKAVILLGISGYAVALLFALQGAPDIALTQIVVESVTLVVFILVLRRLPAYFSFRPVRASKVVRALLAASVGVLVVVLGLLASAARIHRPVSVDFPTEAFEFGYGRNVVNVTLVDIRAWDTFGEISVVVACAVGVASLLFVRDRWGRVDRKRNRLPERTGRGGTVWGVSSHIHRADATLRARSVQSAKATAHDAGLLAPGRAQTLLAGTQTLAPQRRSVILEMGTRLIFHTMLMFSFYLLFAGHNQPGGGFAAGMVVGIALTVRYLAGGRYELGATLPLIPGQLLGSGLILAAASVITPVLFGGAPFQSAVFDFHLPIFGSVHFATALIFDIGVYLIVIGMALDLLRSLGGEIDRHAELKGEDPNADIQEVEPSADVRRGQVSPVLSSDDVDRGIGSDPDLGYSGLRSYRGVSKP